MDILKDHRRRIDDLDQKIISLLAERFSVVDEVSEIKYQHNIPAVLQDRVNEVLENAKKTGVQKGLSTEFMEKLYKLIIQTSCDYEQASMLEKSATHKPRAGKNHENPKQRRV